MGQLDITTSFFPLAWILHFITPRIEINGHPQNRPWGRSVIPLQPGQYQVTVSFPYIFRDRCGPATAVVPIYAGHATVVTYEAPFFTFSNGTMRVTGHRPAA